MNRLIPLFLVALIILTGCDSQKTPKPKKKKRQKLHASNPLEKPAKKVKALHIKTKDEPIEMQKLKMSVSVKAPKFPAEHYYVNSARNTLDLLEKAKKPKFPTTLYSIKQIPGAYFAVFRSTNEMKMTFARISQFTRKHKMTDWKEMQKISRQGFHFGNTNICYLGHDFTGVQLAAFFTKAKGESYSHQEREFVKTLLVNKLFTTDDFLYLPKKNIHIFSLLADKALPQKKREYMLWYDIKRAIFFCSSEYRGLCKDFWEYHMEERDRQAYSTLIRGIGFDVSAPNGVLINFQATLLSSAEGDTSRYTPALRKNLSRAEINKLVAYKDAYPGRMEKLHSLFLKKVVQADFGFVLNKKEYPRLHIPKTAKDLGFMYRHAKGIPIFVLPFAEVNQFYPRPMENYPIGYFKKVQVYKNRKNHLYIEVQTVQNKGGEIKGERLVTVIPGDPTKVSHAYIQGYYKKDGGWEPDGNPVKAKAPKQWKYPEAVRRYYSKHEPAISVRISQNKSRFSLHFGPQTVRGKLRAPSSTGSITVWDKVIVIGNNPPIYAHPKMNPKGHIYWIYELQGAKSHFFSLNAFLWKIHYTKECKLNGKTSDGMALYKSLNGNSTLFINKDTMKIRPGFVWHRSLKRINARSALHPQLLKNVEAKKFPFMVLQEKYFGGTYRWLILIGHKKRVYRTYFVNKAGKIVDEK